VEQLPHALAPRAALAVALGEVADEQLQAPARGVARARRRRRRPPRRADLRAALRADVVQAVHGLAQLHVHALLRALPPPLAPPLQVQNPAHIGQCLAHEVGSVQKNRASWNCPTNVNMMNERFSVRLLKSYG